MIDKCFYELADEVIRLQPPQFDGQFIQADSWQMYRMSVHPDGLTSIYKNSFPKFRDFQNTYFDKIKALTGAQHVNRFTLVRTNPNTVMPPFRKGTGFLILESEDLWGVKWKPETKLAQRVQYIKPYSVQFLRDFGQEVSFRAKTGDEIFTGTNTSLYSYGHALFFTFEL